MNKTDRKAFIRAALLLVPVLGFFPLLPMLISGRWRWWEAWVMAAIFVITFVVGRALAARKTPDILKERARYTRHANTQPWDKWLSPLVSFGVVFIFLAAGMDALYHWSAGFSLGWELFGLALIVLGYLLGSYALVENAFFSGTVRIQEDRGHKVVSSGPYRWVRHPGYAGFMLASFGMPLLLDSAWAYLPVSIQTGFFILRTSLEDRFLQENLPGYREYTQKVRYRLLPGVW
jgi:protein-S-isoprenylcysteine O-methyltransferase Ste14